MNQKEQSTFYNLLPLDRSPQGEMLNGDKFTCKFIIIRYQDINSLVVGQVSDYPYHANLIEEFCDAKGIPSAWQRKPDLLEIFDEETIILGGGWMEIDHSGSSLKIYGTSTAYGKYASKELDELITRIRFFDSLAIAYQ